jgi:small subunit ribosomal protein S21
MHNAIQFKVGDVVRVKAARRRDVHYTIREITASVVVAVNDRGGEARYEPAGFERVERLAGAVRSSNRGDTMSTDDSTLEWQDAAVVRPLAEESIDSVVRRFRKSVQKSGISAELRRHEFFESRSVRRRKKALRARIRRGELSKAA